MKDGRDKNVEFESEVGDTSTRYDRLVVNYYIKYKNDVILVLKSEYFMVSFLLCDSKLIIFGFWTKQDIFLHFIDRTMNQFIDKITNRLINYESNR